MDRGEKEIEPLRTMTVAIEEKNKIEAGRNSHKGDAGGDVLMADLGPAMLATDETYVPPDYNEVLKLVALHQRSKSIEDGSGRRPKVKEKTAKEPKQGRKMPMRSTTRSQVTSSSNLHL